MRLCLTLTTIDQAPVIPVNYQYPLSAVIYKILQRADENYAKFLHDQGYGAGIKRFKFFTFSDLKVSFRITGDRMYLLGRDVTLLVSFHIPDAMERFIHGLFLHQEIEIADYKSRAILSITQVEALPSLPETIEQDDVCKLLLHPISTVVCGLKNEKGNYNFLSPEHPAFVRQLLYNWQEKYTALYGVELADIAFQSAHIEVMPFNTPPKSRLLTVKAGTPAETKIRGWVNFSLKVKGQKEALALLVNTGVGLYNSLGMGMLSFDKN